MKNLSSICMITAVTAVLIVTLLQCSGLPNRGTEITHEVRQTGTPVEQEIDNEPEEADEISFIQSLSTEAASFQEVWAYVVAGYESSLINGLPITDVCYFSAEPNSYGELSGIPRRSAIRNFSGRVHLVITCGSNSLTYFVLRPGSSERQAFISDIITASRDYDGINIDMEYIPARSISAFHSFLRELRSGLPQEKMLTIALHARTRKIADDADDYDIIKPMVDRIFVMAYDEHWSGSAAGSIASLDWCRRVADYAYRTIGPEKLIMGMPFYGRAWGDYSPSRALVYTTTQRIIDENDVTNIRYENGIPTFNYDVNVSIKVYYEDEKSLSARMNMYKSMNVRSIGFWRLGQETREFWNYLQIE